MKAVVFPKFGPAEVLAFQEFDKPIPGPGEALLRVHASGVNRLDVELREGVYGGEPLLDFYFGKAVRFPHVLGVEPAGVIEAVGPGVNHVEPGDRAMPFSHLSCGTCTQCLAGFDNACPKIRVLGVQTPGQGGYAEYLVWPANRLIRFGDRLSFDAAASLLVNYAPVWFGLCERAGLGPGDTLLVTGATGGCGTAAIDIGRLLGARVVAVSSRAEKAQLLRDAGADEVIVADGPGWASAVLDMTDGAGADVVCELVGTATWQDSVSAAGVRGRIAVIGSHSGIRVDMNLGELFGKNLAIHGITRAHRGVVERITRLAESGRLRPSIWKTFPWTDVVQAHRAMEARDHFGKIVLSVARSK